MYKANVSFVCAVAAFILFVDHQKTIGAVSVERVKRADGEKYTTRYDNIDIDRILNSERLLKNYMNCLVDKGKCTPDGLELKKHLADALATECMKCSEIQKKHAGKILSFILQNHPDFWNQLLEKYDKEGNFRKKYEEGADDEDK